jgi:hypothetical protein
MKHQKHSAMVSVSRAIIAKHGLYGNPEGRFSGKALAQFCP